MSEGDTASRIVIELIPESDNVATVVRMISGIMSQGNSIELRPECKLLSSGAAAIWQKFMLSVIEQMLLVGDSEDAVLYSIVRVSAFYIARLECPVKP